jgi:hypothetical protein
MRAISASALTMAYGAMIRLCPNLSTSRPDRGAATAKATLVVAATAPAVA